MSELKQAALRARTVMANARDFLWFEKYEDPSVEWNPGQQAAELQEAIGDLHEALNCDEEAMAKDAERYRFLKKYLSSINYTQRQGEEDKCVEVHGPRWIRRQTLDEAIDCLMRPKDE